MPRRSRRSLRIAVIAAALSVVLAGTAWWVRGDYRYMRIRNALIADVGARSDFIWSGDAPPPAFRTEGRASEEFLAIVEEVLGARTSDSALGDMALLAGHLADRPPNRRSTTSTSASTAVAYHGIRAGRGNCADFAQVMNGMAASLAVPVREWGLFFDDFGGRGHAFNEIWDAGRGAWIFIDAHSGFYVVERATGAPLSVLELRDRLHDGAGLDALDVVSLRTSGPPPRARDEAFVLDHYRRGMRQLALWYANDVFTYDERRLVRLVRPLPKAAEQAIAIAAGIHPRLRILATEDSRAAIATMRHDRNVFLVLAATAGVLTLALVVQWVV